MDARPEQRRVVLLDAVLVAALLIGSGCSSSSPRPSAVPACGRRTGSVTSGSLSSAALHRPVRWDARSAPWSQAKGDVADRPLLVLLHGAGTDSSQWTDIGLDRVIKSTTAHRRDPPPVVLTPDVKAGTSIVDAHRFLAEELIPLARRCFGATDDPTHRAIGGISAGGRVAVFVAGQHPDLFSVAGGHSPAVHRAEAAGLADDLAQARTQVQLDAGRQDGFRSGTIALGEALHERGNAARLRIPPGQHDRAYWRAQLPSYLSFYFARI